MDSTRTPSSTNIINGARSFSKIYVKQNIKSTNNENSFHLTKLNVLQAHIMHVKSVVSRCL